MKPSTSCYCYIILITIRSSLASTISQIYGEELLDMWNIYVSGPYGSRSYKEGDFFTDFRQSIDGRSIQPNHWPDAINLRSGEAIDSIQVFYGNYKGLLHGSEENGKLHKIRLYDGDKITKVSGRRGLGPGAAVDQLTFFTKNGHIFGPYGGEGGYEFLAEPPRPDCYLGWISGRSNVKLDNISFHWRCPVLVRRPEKQQPDNILSDIEYYSSSMASMPSSVTNLTVVLMIIGLLYLRR